EHEQPGAQLSLPDPSAGAAAAHLTSLRRSRSPASSGPVVLRERGHAGAQSRNRTPVLGRLLPKKGDAMWLIARSTPDGNGVQCWTPGSVLLCLGAVLLLAACGGKASSATVTIHATDFTFNQGVPQTHTAGKVHFVLKNDSKSMLH